ncbi:prepilin-type N-terminal cleavage/methylation domain-containing protein [Thalassomonas sp. M1454]|uniref:prepilin-type N-terminal cleavage/methylation domain-containing protein n=1 Tax=Thalassomonas sp. M1454 TaxID=2594477 RepID=UPI00117F84EB|nr:prepilin-type N-terminal cleavage/methylation domain-containing protein [Thalassomonas sp. M1454]TRX52805.1 prepilin-type N-terminal cleavage/methylation domain-containing protein [Thalassomonas sp. M1454]
MKNTKIKATQGFTLIELVIVVVLLGLLAVTAIPKFIDLTEQAQDANIEGMAGGFATAVSLARAQWEAEGRQNDGTNNVVDYDGSVLILTAEDKANGVRPGYPIALEGGDTSLSATDCVDIWNNILQQPPLLTSSIDDLNGVDSDSYKYFVTLEGTGAQSYCAYFLKESLVRSGDDYVAPEDETEGNNFTYQPATSHVVVHHPVD